MTVGRGWARRRGLRHQGAPNPLIPLSPLLPESFQAWAWMVEMETPDTLGSRTTTAPLPIKELLPALWRWKSMRAPLWALSDNGTKSANQPWES